MESHARYRVNSAEVIAYTTKQEANLPKKL